MTDTIPFLVILVIPFIGKLDASAVVFVGGGHKFARVVGLFGVVVVSCWSVLAHAQGAIMGEPSCWNRVPADIDQDPSRVWDLEDPQVTSGLRHLLGGTPRTNQKWKCL
jgi:hypothetical protein